MSLVTKTTFELKRDAVTDTGHFSGYASTFGGEPDSVGDVILKGAFADAIALHKKQGTMPAMLWNHKSDEPIGAWLELAEDNHGLLVAGKLTIGTQKGREAMALINDDAIKLSIGFFVASNGSQVKNGIRYISKVSRLVEISMVALPANPRAVITRKESEHLMRKAFGVSRNEAKKLMAGGVGELVRNGRIDEFTSLVDSIKQLQHETISTR